jgi:hypothetical protein
MFMNDVNIKQILSDSAKTDRLVLRYPLKTPIILETE